MNTMSARLSWLPALVVIATAAWGADDARDTFNRAVSDFKAGRIAESAAGFDRVAKLAPGSAPQLWQRGIALYYAGRYKECREQFESHRTVNPDDVENAAWHFLCVARAESPAKAKAAYEDFFRIWTDAEGDLPLLGQAKVEYSRL